MTYPPVPPDGETRGTPQPDQPYYPPPMYPAPSMPLPPGYSPPSMPYPPPGYAPASGAYLPQPGYPPTGQPFPQPGVPFMMPPGYGFPVMAPPAPPTNGMAVTAMVLGIVSIVLFCSPFIALVSGGLAITFSLIAMNQLKRLPFPPGSNRGMAMAGLITGIIGAALGVLLAIASIAINMANLH